MQIRKKLSFNSQNLHVILNILGNKTRLVGGCVRDKLLLQEPADIDIATSLLPTKVIELFARYPNIKIVTDGFKFGCVRAVLRGEVFEITTLRRDVSTDGRHAVVEFTDDFQLDASRRDFTINAMSYSLEDDALYDYFNGLEHLQDKKVIFIGDPYQRIMEDYLRILRFFRFSAYYAKKLDEKCLDICLHHKSLLQNLSSERIQHELDKLIMAPGIYVIEQMKDILAIWGLNIDTYWLRYAGELALDAKYALLFYKSYDLKAKLIYLRFPRRFINKVINYVDFLKSVNRLNMREYVINRIAVAGEVEQYIKLGLIMELLDMEDIKYLEPKIYGQRFPVDGEMLKGLGYSGPGIGHKLKSLKKIWLYRDRKMSKEELLECAESFL